MLAIDEELKKIYKTNYFPACDKLTSMRIKLYFPELDLTIWDDQVDNRSSLKLTERLCSEDDLTFGGCEAATMEIRIADVVHDLKERICVVTQIVDDKYIMPLGTYKVKSAKKTNDLRYKDILAYDMSKEKMDMDVSGWYNAFFAGNSEKTLREFRFSFFDYIGMEIVNQELTNDDMIVSKTLEPPNLPARLVGCAIGEVSASFGHMTRENKFKYTDLSGIGLYPSETLYPSEELFPSEALESLGAGSYISSYREEYFVQPITALQVRQDEGDIGYTEGDGDNPYVIQGNFLLYGKSAIELQTIAHKIFLKIKNKFYVPHETVMVGLPYLEVGDSIQLHTGEDIVETFIFNRTLNICGTSLRDEISATGNEYRDNSVSQAMEIMQLQAKTMRIDKSVEGLKVELKDTAEGLESQIDLTAEELKTEFKDTEVGLESRISQVAGEVAIKVTQGDVSHQLSIETEQVFIGGNRLVVECTNFDLDKNGNLQLSGTIKASVINGSEIIGSTLYLASEDTKTTLSVNRYGQIVFTKSGSNNGSVEIGPVIGMARNCGIKVTDSFGDSCTIEGPYLSGIIQINGYTPITTGNIGSYAVTPSTVRYYVPASTGEISLTNNGNNNIRFSNSGLFGASTEWVLANFARSSSDVRLKKDIRTLDRDTVVKLYNALEVYSYKFKMGTINDDGKTYMGLIAQELMTLFESNGLDWRAYNIIEEKDPADTDFAQDAWIYTGGDFYYVINYENLHALHIAFGQELYRENAELKEEVTGLKSELTELKKALRLKGVI